MVLGVFDGVVLISDTKFTSDVGGITFTYDNQKIFAGISGVIMGFSGTRGKFELFQTAIMDYIETSTRCNKIVTRHQFILRAFELTQKYREFEILIGMTGNPSTLQRMYEGGIETINSHAVIGTGEPVGRFLLNKYWRKDMDMKQVAELGYFIIKVIMQYELENTVGLSKATDNEILSKPRIHFIPDNKEDYQAEKPFLEECEKNVNARLEKLKEM